MAEPDKKKDIWDKIASITPLILGIAISGVGAFFSQVYNFRQLQLNQITALDKFRPLLTSEKPEDREFGYASFAALGYENIAIRIVQIKKDESGRSVLVELEKTGTPQAQANARVALNTLDKAQILVNIADFGKAEPDKELLKEHPEYGTPFTSGANWAEETAHALGISSKLGVAILYDTAHNSGIGMARRLQETASATVSPPLNSREKEAAWLTAFLDERDKAMQKGPFAKIYPTIKKRIDRLLHLIKAGDWELQSIETPNKSVETEAQQAAPPSP
jgi:hypothetical protein